MNAVLTTSTSILQDLSASQVANPKIPDLYSNTQNNAHLTDSINNNINTPPLGPGLTNNINNSTLSSSLTSTGALTNDKFLDSQYAYHNLSEPGAAAYSRTHHLETPQVQEAEKLGKPNKKPVLVHQHLDIDVDFFGFFSCTITYDYLQFLVLCAVRLVLLGV
jgi:hypothetical protein